MVEYNRKCKKCQKKFIAKRSDKVFCDSRCKDKHSYKYEGIRVSLEKKHCVICHSLFSPMSCRHKFCSPRCKDRCAYNKKLSGVYKDTANAVKAHNTFKCKLKREYNLSLEEFNAMVAFQNNKCAICFKSETSKNQYGIKRLSVDHCHETGQVRGLLCSRCNRGLGYFKDNPTYLIRAMNYVVKGGIDYE